MRLKPDLIKKLLLLVIAITTITLLSFPPLKAQSTDTTTTTPTIGGNTGSTTEEYLYNIMQNTYGILLAVNNLPVYMQTLTDMANAWLMKDESDGTATLQGMFADMSNTYLAANDARPPLQPQLLQDLFQKATTATLPNANDLSYQTLLGMPYFAQDPRNPPGQKPPPNDPPYNYIKNASGISISHVMPSRNTFIGPDQDQTKYESFYNTLMSVESFNAYVMSGLYVDYLNGGKLTEIQNTLISQASNSDWFSQVAAERIGVVLRQILMYISQSFVLQTQMIQLQKQALTAQIMTNTLLIANASNAEQTLLQKASGIAPR